jgi:hypothetical protein
MPEVTPKANPALGQEEEISAEPVNGAEMDPPAVPVGVEREASAEPVKVAAMEQPAEPVGILEQEMEALAEPEKVAAAPDSALEPEEKGDPSQRIGFPAADIPAVPVAAAVTMPESDVELSQGECPFSFILSANGDSLRSWPNYASTLTSSTPADSADPQYLAGRHHFRPLQSIGSAGYFFIQISPCQPSKQEPIPLPFSGT